MIELVFFTITIASLAAFISSFFCIRDFVKRDMKNFKRNVKYLFLAACLIIVSRLSMGLTMTAGKAVANVCYSQKPATRSVDNYERSFFEQNSRRVSDDGRNGKETIFDIF